MREEDIIKIEECFQEANITDELSFSSIKKYKSSIKKFFDIMGDKKLQDISNKDINDFMLKMKNDGAGGARIRSIINAVKWIVVKMQNKGIIFHQLDLLKIKQPKIIKKEVIYLTEDEIMQFFGCIEEDINKKKNVKNIRLMALVYFLLQTGARIGEALSINTDDIDRQNMEVQIIGKGGKPRILFLREETLNWLDGYLAIRGDKQEGLFITQNGASRWQQTDVGRSFRKYKKMSGIQKKFTIHTLRHTFATQLLQRGTPLPTVQYFLGHSSPMTTLKYYSGVVEKVKAKEELESSHFNFLPEVALKNS